MRRLTLVWLAGLAIAIAVAMKGQGTRSMKAGGPIAANGATTFDPAQSVALFVGARTFSEDESLEMVPYAVDDAVDLAFMFALDPRVSLVQPKHVVLALSDQAPRKPISQRRLAELKRKGAIVVPASQSRILKAMAHEAGVVGAKGIFIVSYASHGFSEDGSQYLLASNSLFREFNTAIPVARIFDLVAQSNTGRSLILIDACRERVKKQRSAAPERLSAAPLLQRMGPIQGQVVLYGAAAGKWAYDDDLRQNGVFTGAVLDGLQCRAGHDPSGLVTVDALSVMIERNVLAWIRTNRDPSVRNATQANFDGAARVMPLAVCSRPAPPDPPAVSDDALASRPDRRTPVRQRLEYCQADGKSLMSLYDSQDPDRFVTAYVGWRDGCVAALRDLDARFPRRKSSESETVRFVSVANHWCA